MVVTDYNEQFLDKRGTDHLIEELKAYIDGIASGDIDLSNYVTKSELQAKLDALDINIDLSSYATKEELTNAINSIDLSAYALKAEIPSLDGLATTEYVDNAIANIPSGGGGNVDLSNYYTKEETDERDLMILPFNSLGEKYITDNMPNIKAYAGTNTITFKAGMYVRGGILVDGKAPYYFNDYSEIDSSKNSFTFEADKEVIVKDYVFYFGTSTEGLSKLTVTITNGSKSDVYSIPIYGDGTQEVYYRKIKNPPLYIKKTKFGFANRFSPLCKQVYKNRDEITKLKESGISGKDGITPHIDSTTKHWMIGNTDTGVIAEGSDGVSPTVTVTKEGKIATITCTDVNGTTTATISDGADGQGGGGGTTDLSNYYTKSETYNKAEVNTLVANSGGGGSSSGGITYAFDTEIATGDTWVDGKPIYMRVFDFTNVTPMSISGYNLYMTTYEDWLINEVIDSRLAFRNGNGYYTTENPYQGMIPQTSNIKTLVNDINSYITTRGIYHAIAISEKQTTIQVLIGTWYKEPSKKIYFTVKYTKP